MMCEVNKSPGPLVSLRHRLRVAAVQLAVVLALGRGAAAAPAAPTAQVFVESEAAPPGATVQLKFFLSQPSLIASGELALDLDPTVFSSITAVSAFSANGDAAGVAQIQGLHVDARFASANGGIGRLSQLPLVVVTATVLSNAATGKTASITADPSGSPWLDLLGNVYSVSVIPGTVTVGGTLSITSITPGGGVLPSGTAIAIQGTGFSSGATAEIDGATVASVQVTSAQTMSLILGGPTELTGKRIGITNPDGSEVDAFAFVPAAAVSLPGTETPIVPILPTETYTAAQILGAAFISIQNPTAAAVQVALDKIATLGEFDSEQSYTIPAGGSLLLTSPVSDIRAGWALVIASAPVQMVQINQLYTGFMVANGLGASAPSPVPVGPLEVGATTPDSLNSLSWVWQAGSTTPQTQTIVVTLPNQPATDYAVSLMTSTGGPWLSVAPSGTIHCAVGVSPNPCTTLQVSVNPSSLTPGIYRGTITITPVATFSRPLVEPAVIPVTLTVTAAQLPQILITPRFLHPNNSTDSVAPPLGFITGSASVSVVTDSGGNWLSASPYSTVAPAGIDIAANVAGLGVGTYSGDVIVTGSGSTLVIPVQLIVDGSDRLVALDPTASNPASAGSIGSLNVVVRAGAAPPPAQIVPVGNEDCSPTQCFNMNPGLSSLAAAVQTHSGGNWLSVSVSQGTVAVTTNPAGLSAGIYLGAVTLTANGVASAQFPVVLVVEAISISPPALTAGPGLVTAFESQAGAAGVQPLGPNMICVTSESVPQNFTVQISTSDGGGWLSVANTGGTTPECIGFSFNATQLGPGTYSGNIVFTSGTQSANVQVALVVGEPPGQPLLGAVVSADSTIPGAIYPGEILAIHGLNLTPSMVLVGGIPATILSATPTLISTLVPYTLAGASSVTVQVQNTNSSTAVWTLPLAPQPAARPYHRLH